MEDCNLQGWWVTGQAPGPKQVVEPLTTDVGTCQRMTMQLYTCLTTWHLSVSKQIAKQAAAATDQLTQGFRRSKFVVKLLISTTSSRKLQAQLGLQKAGLKHFCAKLCKPQPACGCLPS